MKKVFVVGPSRGYSRFIKDKELVDDISIADIVLFTGGEDISPKLYHCEKHHTTYFNKMRDTFEVEAFHNVRPDQLAVGICRGAQLFCALYGGKLVQDCTGHCGGDHTITDGKHRYTITSIHHQMQYPFELPKEDYDILYRSEANLSRHYLGDGIDPNVLLENGEPEVVVYHRPGLPTCIGIQGHPEMMPDSPVADMANELINKCLESLQH